MDRCPHKYRPAGRPQQKPPPKNGGGLKGLLGLLPEHIDTGDLMLLLLLFLLYTESHDEDFLIILIVVGLSIFKGK